ncbi:hypothetical protein [Ruegeria hyattellae]|uniref:hypothetical protein n=1 Tax=Ruegeria hyattellae TaxID=3233337 RepID=UPI00355C7E42
MTVLTAKQASDALSSICAALSDVGIIQDIGVSALSRIAGELKGFGNSHTWNYEVDRGLPILFSETVDTNKNPIVPKVVAEMVAVDQSDGVLTAFDALCVAIEFDHVYDNRPTPRWHLDMANQKEPGNWQPGPMTHLQYGGHLHGDRTLDCFLKTPRWCHPPMEVGLLCEIVAANFYEAEWNELREMPNWNTAICTLQKICLHDYATRLASTLNQSSKSFLHTMWAQDWADEAAS